MPLDGSPPSPQVGSNLRLNSWKEIAAYLRAGVRTVQRWEKTEGLPVHRHLHQAQGSVYALTKEIDDWRRRRSTALPATEPFALPPAPSPRPIVGRAPELTRLQGYWNSVLEGT